MSAPRVEFARFKVALRSSFKHASATRSETDAVIVRIGTPGSPDCGFGEACPRPYVTGETAASVTRFVARLGSDFAAAVHDVSDLRAWIDENGADIDANPAAFAALELAMLDRIGRQQNLPLEALLSDRPALRPATYSAILGDSSMAKFAAQSCGYRLFGMHDIKIKLSDDPERDRKKIRILRQLFGPQPAIRADANNLWHDPEEAIAHLTQAEAGLWAIEEPLKPGDIDGCRLLSRRLNLRIILDESLSRTRHLDPLAEDPCRWIANIRVSKVGGILRAIDLGNRAAATGVSVILGAHVGETSLLTRAALVVANCLHTPPMAMEGGFGTRLLASDLTTSSLMFGRGGRVQHARHAAFSKPGNGLDVRPDDLVFG